MTISLSGCGKKDPGVVHVYNVKGQYFNRFNTYLDKNTCKVVTQDLEPIDADASELDSLVCITKEEYSKRKAQVKADCENSK